MDREERKRGLANMAERQWTHDDRNIAASDVLPAELAGAEIDERHRSSNGKDVQQKRWFLALNK